MQVCFTLPTEVLTALCKFPMVFAPVALTYPTVDMDSLTRQVIHLNKTKSLTLKISLTKWEPKALKWDYPPGLK